MAQDTPRATTPSDDHGTAKDTGSTTRPASGASPAPGTSGTSDPLRRSRAGGFYLAIVALGIVLILLVVFILQNTEKTPVNFLMFSADIPVAVALLVAAAAGILLAGLAASLRIFQLRRRVKKERKR